MCSSFHRASTKKRSILSILFSKTCNHVSWYFGTAWISKDPELHPPSLLCTLTSFFTLGDNVMEKISSGPTLGRGVHSWYIFVPSQFGFLKKKKLFNFRQLYLKWITLMQSTAWQSITRSWWMSTCSRTSTCTSAFQSCSSTSATRNSWDPRRRSPRTREWHLANKIATSNLWE